MSQPYTRICIGIVIAALLSLRSSANGQSRETLETKVTASGNEIILKWTKKHPWDAVLVAQGASLYAGYRTARGVGIECLQPANATANINLTVGVRRGGGYPSSCFTGNPVRRAEERTIHFQLPETLTAEALGGVCLEFRLPDQRLLPIRLSSNRAEDTVRFQYEEWSRNAAGRVLASTAENKRVALQSAVSTQTAAVKEQEESNSRKGWQNEAACNHVSVGSVEITSSNRPIAAPGPEQDGVARMMCVIRLDNSKQRLDKANPPGVVLPFLDDVESAMVDRWVAVRGPQIKAYLDDWKALSPGISAFKSKFPVAHFGTYQESLSIQSLTVLDGKSINEAVSKKEKPDAQSVLGYVGGSVEAYDRCVRDGKRQLDLNYQQAQALKTTVETLPERLRAQAVQECRDGVTKLDSMRSRLTTYRQDLDTLERQLNQFKFIPLNAKPRDLNSVMCTP
jgi:hypothetical protein